MFVRRMFIHLQLYWPALLICGVVLLTSSALTNAQAPEKGTREHKQFQKDRQAILDLAGEYQVSFKFFETIALREGYELRDPYKANATELVKVVEDQGDMISLQHILVLHRDTDDEGKTTRVVKHWREAWRYEDRTIYQFKGDRTWKPQQLSKSQADGTWSQAVFSIDGSPRYESYGKWTHQNNVSAWTGK